MNSTMALTEEETLKRIRSILLQDSFKFSRLFLLFIVHSLDLSRRFLLYQIDLTIF
jgi:hypothetical protein